MSSHEGSQIEDPLKLNQNARFNQTMNTLKVGGGAAQPVGNFFADNGTFADRAN